MKHNTPLQSPVALAQIAEEAHKQGKLLLQVCQDCHSWQATPGPVCQQCGSTNWQWQESAGKGKVWSAVRFHQRYYPDSGHEPPYTVVCVELEEGPLVMSNMNEKDLLPNIGDAVESTLGQDFQGNESVLFKLVTS